MKGNHIGFDGRPDVLRVPDDQAAPFITSIIDAGRVSEGLSSCAPGRPDYRLGNLSPQQTVVLNILLAATRPMRADQLDRLAPGCRSSSRAMSVAVFYIRGKLGADMIDSSPRGYSITQTGRQRIAALREAT